MDRLDDIEDRAPKRRAVETVATGPDAQRVQWQPSNGLNEDQLRGKGTEELKEIIYEMQASFDNKFDDLSARYNALSNDMINVKKCIVTFFQAQNANADTAAQFLLDKNPPPAPNTAHHPPSLASFAPRPPQLPQPFPQQQPLPTPPALAPSGPYVSQAPAPTSINHSSPVTSTPAPRPVVFAEKRVHTPLNPPAGVPNPSQNGAPFSPTSTPNAEGSPHIKSAPPYLQVTPPEKEGDAPTVIYSNAPDVATVWREYRYGAPDVPSLESLDNDHGSTWRPDPRGRTWYSRRKLIQDKIKELLHDGLTEEAAIQELEKLRGGRSMNNLMNVLAQNRKETKANWKAAAAAAKAAKDASRGRPAAQVPPAVMQGSPAPAPPPPPPPPSQY